MKTMRGKGTIGNEWNERERKDMEAMRGRRREIYINQREQHRTDKKKKEGKKVAAIATETNRKRQEPKKIRR